ncbi:hypothetical protein PHLGIDRAFT_31183 [Phlebiopsis gigantea 11061_1 CR5-6]|uniref:Cytochrome P450 n=1 Tax=Phlebiopsis gigantea (strain 11061_1 CR5-6) TaxID=745531 RepID=A0A0C3NIV3_PHLG1|nr:hypothetical protein PHLGIDRAFT_31183 [Phlebiopsis gigantea 11061_1 CR5-6]
MQKPDTLLLLKVAIVGLACTWLLVKLQEWLNNRKSLPLPPGPATPWFQLGPRVPLLFAEMTEKYGPVFSFRQGSRVVCVVGRYQSAVDIMQKHGAALADRPLSIAAGEIMSGGKRTLLVGAGERLKKLRKALHSRLQPTVAVQYRPTQYKHAVNYLLDVISDPEHHVEHARRYAASVVMSSTYGKIGPTYYSDPEVQGIVVHGARLGEVVQIGSHVVDRYPILRNIPFVTSTLRRWHEEELGMFSKLVDDVRAKVQAGNAQPCFATYLLENQRELQLSDDEIAYLAGSMFGAGSDTSASAIAFVTMAAAKYPETQVAVQAQLDAVVGKDRLPTFGDESLLPLVAAFYLEAYRWRPISYGGFAHRATTDIVWNEYVIPAGATVIGNHWAISRDPDVFPDPEVFRPSRWLNEKGQIRTDISSFNFGFGRRVCVGQHVANSSLFINTALILWAFNISEDPSTPIDDMNFSDTANVRPGPFKAVFTPRIDGLRKLVESHVE